MNSPVNIFVCIGFFFLIILFRCTLLILANSTEQANSNQAALSNGDISWIQESRDGTVHNTPKTQSPTCSACKPTTIDKITQQPLHIAIIGGGPRGISVVERICAVAPADRVLEIHIIDSVLLGGGSVWNTSGNNNRLVMNTVMSQVTIFTDPTVTCSGPIRQGPTMYEWAIQHDSHNGPQPGPNDYASRAQYGRYLNWALGHIKELAPGNVRIKEHLAHAIRLDDAGCSRHQIVALSDGQVLHGIAAVVLALGHLPQQLTGDEEQQRAYASTHSLRYIPPANPANVELDMIQAQEKVFIRGLGLCFFDYLSLFTEGRGGRFTTEPDGSLKYHASGKEPLLFAGSSRGVPHRARPKNEKGVNVYHRPLLLTDDNLARFRNQAKQGKPPSFSRDIQPLIMREMESVYYTTLLQQRGQDFSGFRHLATASPYIPLTLPQLQQFGIIQKDKESWESSLNPRLPAKMTYTEHRDWIISYLVEDSRQAALGNINGPHAAARDALRDLRNCIRLAIDHDGISGDSREADVDAYFTPESNFISVGPPRFRIDQAAALIRAGILSIMGPGIRVDRGDHMWVARSPTIPDYQLHVMTLIEARLPKPCVSRTSDPLLSYLLETGQCRPHKIDGYESGALDITAAPYNLRDGRGRPHPARLVLGVPTEGIHWTTTAGARPCINSAMLRESDEVAQAVLRLIKGA